MRVCERGMRSCEVCVCVCVCIPRATGHWSDEEIAGGSSEEENGCVCVRYACM